MNPSLKFEEINVF